MTCFQTLVTTLAAMHGPHRLLCTGSHTLTKKYCLGQYLPFRTRLDFCIKYHFKVVLVKK